MYMRMFFFVFSSFARGIMTGTFENEKTRVKNEKNENK